ncbi:hypothetical protein PAXRUDRAFT_609313, partial [Paxillus rubicundulus Ve08.2h10]
MESFALAIYEQCSTIFPLPPPLDLPLSFSPFRCSSVITSAPSPLLLVRVHTTSSSFLFLIHTTASSRVLTPHFHRMISADYHPPVIHRRSLFCNYIIHAYSGIWCLHISYLNVIWGICMPSLKPQVQNEYKFLGVSCTS